jgi:ABC-type nitrate/sulfonate/bicarbonate transport system substrate-binding protein
MPAYGLNRIAALFAVALLAAAAPAQAQPAEDAVLAVPNVALTFAPGYLAEDLGLFAKHGLNLKSVVIAGIGSANALLAAGFAEIRKGAPRPPVAGKADLENSELFNVGAGLLKPEEKLKSYDGLYTDEYVR